MTRGRVKKFLQQTPVVLDGGLGTELERRGIATPAPLWSASAIDAAPATLREIHADFVQAGADVIFANTFRVHAGILDRVNRASDGARLAASAVRIARDAAGAVDREILVAASLGPLADCYCPDETPDDATLHEAHTRTGRWLAGANPDMVWLETMNTIREARSAAAAVHANDLPLAVSFMLQEDGRLLGGDALRDAIEAVHEYHPVAIGLNCMPPSGISRWLPALSEFVGPTPVAAYAHVDNAVPLPGWHDAEFATPAEYAAFTRTWRHLGATILGGCCGTTPAHIAAIQEGMRRSAE
ncbi:MAG: homocysteine S-methyltransferase family protein [Phycisphaerae bacterium]